jgi:hypothetical protein
MNGECSCLVFSFFILSFFHLSVSVSVSHVIKTKSTAHFTCLCPLYYLYYVHTYYKLYKKHVLYVQFKGFSGVILTIHDWVYAPSSERNPMWGMWLHCLPCPKHEHVNADMQNCIEQRRSKIQTPIVIWFLNSYAFYVIQKLQVLKKLCFICVKWTLLQTM